MGFSLNSSLGGIITLLVCTLEIFASTDFKNGTAQKKIIVVDEFRYESKNTTLSAIDYPVQNQTSNASLQVPNAAVQENELSKTLRKYKRRKDKRRRRQHTVVSTESTTSQTVNRTEPNKDVKKKRRKKLKRRRNKKYHRKQKKHENSNILEITTAKEMLFSTNSNSTNSNSDPTIHELIRKLNENPEHNFEEFRNVGSNENKTASGKKVENLVAPVPVNSKFSAAFHKNVTLHITLDNRTNYKMAKRTNRCRKNKGGCTHICNPKGKIRCSCLKGFELDAGQRTCLDIDECKINNGGCQNECHNSLGAYECRCPIGLRLADDFKSCEDVNECLLRNGHGLCQDTCENTLGSYTCSCRGLNGTVLGDDGHSCTDINECNDNNGGCSHKCINTLGKAFCSCPDGMELTSDWKTCQDINECEDHTIKSSCRNCVNTGGSYYCMDTYTTDSDSYINDEPPPITTCKPLPLPSIGYINCSRGGARKIYSKTGRERIMNSPGTICKLVCPVGYKMVGHFYVACAQNGKWVGKTEARCAKVDPPSLSCPANQAFTVDRKTKKVLVEFPSPKTNISWKYVKSYPPWGKELSRILKVGHYVINFIARDPNSKLSTSCTFKIDVRN